MKLTIAELNELIYACGVAEYQGMFVNKTVLDNVQYVLRQELDKVIKEDEELRKKTQRQANFIEVPAITIEKEPKIITPIVDTGSEVADFLITAAAAIQEGNVDVGEVEEAKPKKAKFPGTRKSNLMEPEK